MNLEGIERIRQRLQTLSPNRISSPRDGKAAVLMAITCHDDEPHFLLTRRTQNVATHKGQISFPGGTREPQDESLLATALRETEEEIGIAQESITVLGEFNDYTAITSQLVRTFAGLLPHSPSFSPHPGEVAYLIEVPFSFFVSKPPVVKQELRRGRIRPVYYYDYQGEIIWGLTARMIKDFLDCLQWKLP